MLSVRNAVVGALALLLVSLLFSLAAMLKDPDSGGQGKDTFGVRAYGYRAIMETLGESGVSITRSFTPPVVEGLSAETIVFIAPSVAIVATEPGYLASLKDWVESGGRLVYAPPAENLYVTAALMQMEGPTPSFAELLELDGVRIEGGSDSDGSSAVIERAQNADSFAEGFVEAFNVPNPNTLEVTVTVEGDFARIAQGVRNLTIPADDFTHIALDSDAREPAGILKCVPANGEQATLAARFVQGDGEIIVLSDSRLISNLFLAQSDNSVLAARLFSPEGRSVVVDEFYHGLGVRGQPLYLLTFPTYATVAAAILIAIGLFTWRKAVFPGPPIPDDEVRRRDIREYVNAMARFLSVGKDGNSRLVSELREGVLRQLSIETGLPPDSADVERIVSVLERKQGDRAKLLREADRTVSEILNKRRRLSQSETLDAMQRMTACL